MALKRKASPPRPQVHLFYEYSSSDEEGNVVTPIVYDQSKPPQHTQPQSPVPQVEYDDSETESECDYHHDPVAQYSIVHYKPLESEESLDEEEEEEPKLSQRKAEFEPKKKKPKLLTFSTARIWSKQDEMALLRALLQYHARTGRLPPSKEYASFLSLISGSIGFPVTEKQLSNKIRMMKQNYLKKKEMGADAKISKPHDKAIFDMSTILFNDTKKASKKGRKAGSSSDTDTDNGCSAGVGAAIGGVANGSVAHAGAVNGDALARSNIYLRSFIEENLRKHPLPSRLTVEDVIARFEKLTVQKMNAEIKDLTIEAMKLHAKEDNMKIELFTKIAEAMTEIN